ncbi:hypothetical protein PPYR_02055 [Photinus pyralis]|uniref:Uncharacterized protein n=1 Tax=Photinus pyralis TaxID=7054 RepID=A0A1Y1LQT8_PHOPY|nr:hypothetical protein PPYR_02055 [Photinus pyralis]
MDLLVNELTSLGECNWKPVLKISDMQIGEKYKLCGIKAVQTHKYGRKIVVETDTHSIFLPERFSKAYSDAKIKEIVGSINRMALIFLGEVNIGKKNSLLKISFTDA